MKYTDLMDMYYTKDTFALSERGGEIVLTWDMGLKRPENFINSLF
jgi:hypothetical protein